jgi:hypothetical protein
MHTRIRVCLVRERERERERGGVRGEAGRGSASTTTEAGVREAARRIAWELLCLLRWKVINYRRLIMGTARGVIDVCRGSCSGLAPYTPHGYACKHIPRLHVIHIVCGKYLMA